MSGIFHSVTEALVSLAIQNLQRPTGEILVNTGRTMQIAGRNLEKTGQHLIDTAPAAPKPVGETA